MTNARRAATGLFILLSVALAATCSNPVNLLVELEREVMRANDRFLVVKAITMPTEPDDTFIPTGTISIAFDRPVNLGTVSDSTIVFIPASGEPLTYPPEGVSYIAESNTLRVRVLPFLDANTDFTIRVTGVKGADGAALDEVDPANWKTFRTTNILTATIESIASNDVTSNDGYTKSNLIDLDLAVGNLYPYIRYTITANATTVKTEDWAARPSGGAIRVENLDLGALGDGSIEITVAFYGNTWAYESGSKAGMAPEGTIIMDRDRPSPPAAPDLTAASDTGASDSDNVTKLSTGLVFNGNLGAGEVGSTLTLLVDGVEEATAVADATGAWEATVLSALVDGARSVTATVSDAAGWISDPSGALSVTIDATVPLPGTWAVGASEYVNTTTHDIAASVVPSTDVVEMAFSNDGMAWSPWESYMATRTDWDFADGAYGGNATEELKTIHVQVRDLAGNEASTSDTVRYDVTAPVLSLFRINGTGDGTHAYVNTVNTTIAVTATDASPLEYSYDSGGGWSAWSTSTVCALPAGDGEKTVNLQVRDRAGNQATGPLTDAIILDTLAPSGVSITTPGSGTTVHDVALSVSATASDENAVHRVEFYFDGDYLGSATAAPYSRTISTIDFMEGSRTLKVMAYDRAGNSTSYQHPVTVDNFQVDNNLFDFSKLLLLENFGSTRSLAADSKFDRLYLAVAVDSTLDYVALVSSFDDGNTWSLTDTSPTPNGGNNPVILVDSTGVLHLVFTLESSLYYTYSNDLGVKWSTPVRVASSVLGTTGPALGYAAAAGLLHIAYVNTSYELIYALLPLRATKFTNAEVLHKPALSPSVNVTADAVHLAWHDPDRFGLVYASRDPALGKEISRATLLEPTDSGDHPSIAAGTKGEVFIASGDGKSNELLWSSFWDGKDWNFGELVGKSPNTEAAASAALDGLGDPIFHVAAYSRSTGKLTLAKSDDMARWYPVMILDKLANETGRGPSMLSDGTYQYVAYYDGDLKATRFMRIRLNY